MTILRTVQQFAVMTRFPGLIRIPIELIRLTRLTLKMGNGTRQKVP
ncbi:MAG TPA: hypothetical protein VHY09_14380 [Candidatus Methylacidiphilales bacterium]|jgi:hypothetical protein|nr:hypothetical protein [Candidatus Methylacidiphilales bacterium]